MCSWNICVIGGGVVGLTAALEIQQCIPGAEVTIIAERFNTETTSDGAAGLFYPFATFKAKTFEMARRIVKDSYDYYDDLMRTENDSSAGITETSGFILSNISQKEVECPLIEGAVPEYRILTSDEASKCPGGWKYGCFIKTLIINGRLFLPWALRKYQLQGGKVIQRKLSSFRDLKPYNFDLILNCTGLGAQELCGDREVVPVRGQVIKVSAPWVKHFYLVDDGIYVIPGFETTLGGTKNYNDYNLNVEEETTEHIWRKCLELVPSLKDGAVIRNWVGLRPQRIPIRLEPEVIHVDGQKLNVIHNYGHGSQGVTTAPGSARFCVEYARKMLREADKM